MNSASLLLGLRSREAVPSLSLLDRFLHESDSISIRSPPWELFGLLLHGPLLDLRLLC